MKIISALRIKILWGAAEAFSSLYCRFREVSRPQAVSYFRKLSIARISDELAGNWCAVVDEFQFERQILA